MEFIKLKNLYTLNASLLETFPPWIYNLMDVYNFEKQNKVKKLIVKD